VMRPHARPSRPAWCVARAANRSRAICLSNAAIRGPSCPTGSSTRPSRNRAARPSPATMSRATPSTGIVAPMLGVRATGLVDRCLRTQSARASRNANASVSRAKFGIDNVTRPELRDTRSVKRRARADRVTATSTGGSPFRMWILKLMRVLPLIPLQLRRSRALQPAGIVARGLNSSIAMIEGGVMPKEEWGVKRVCPTTGKRFYDLGKTPVVSPYTGDVVEIDTGKASRTLTPDKPEKSKVKKPADDAVVDGDDALLDDDDNDIELDDDLLEDDEEEDTVPLDDLKDVASDDDDT